MKKQVGIKQREGGKSASLTYPVAVRSGRRTQKVRLSIGAVRLDDDGTGEPFGAGFIKFADGCGASMFNEADLAAVHAWLELAAAKRMERVPPDRVSMAELGIKLDELLGLVRHAGSQAGSVAPTLVPAMSAAPPPVYVLPEEPTLDEDPESKLLRLLRTFNAAAAAIAPMMPRAAGVFHSRYRFRPETVEEVERSWVLAASMDRRLNGRSQLKRTGSREEQAQARFGTVEAVDAAVDVAEADDQTGS